MEYSWENMHVDIDGLRVNPNLLFFFIVKVGRSWPESLYKQKRKLLGQIWALQPKVGQAFEKLRSSSIFSADMFVKVCRYFTEREILCACLESLPKRRLFGKLLTKQKQETLTLGYYPFKRSTFFLTDV